MSIDEPRGATPRGAAPPWFMQSVLTEEEATEEEATKEEATKEEATPRSRSPPPWPPPPSPGPRAAEAGESGEAGGLPQPLRPPRPWPPRHADLAHCFPSAAVESPDLPPGRPAERYVSRPGDRGSRRGELTADRKIPPRISSPSAADDSPLRRTGGPTSRDRYSPCLRPGGSARRSLKRSAPPIHSRSSRRWSPREGRPSRLPNRRRRTARRGRAGRRDPVPLHASVPH